MIFSKLVKILACKYLFIGLLLFNINLILEFD